MQIHIESTPNTNAKKFNIIGLENKIQKSHFLRSKEQAKKYSTIAVKLFEIESIATVFLFQNFITITKTPEGEWLALEKQILNIIYSYINSASNNTTNTSHKSSHAVHKASTGNPKKTIPQTQINLLDIYHKNTQDNHVNTQNNNTNHTNKNNNNNDDIQNDDIQDDTNKRIIISKIEELIATRIRPSVAQDGGDILFHSYDDTGIVKVILTGACNGCEQSHITLKQGVESLLKYYIPSITSVECIEHDDLLNDIYNIK